MSYKCAIELVSDALMFFFLSFFRFFLCLLIFFVFLFYIHMPCAIYSLRLFHIWRCCWVELTLSENLYFILVSLKGLYV